MDSNLFMVSYAGNHSHPVPTHRDSLAGSRLNRSLSEVGPADRPRCSSPISASSLSPPTSLLVFREEEISKTKKRKLLVEEEEEDEVKEEDEDDDEIPILNVEHGNDRRNINRVSRARMSKLC